MTDTIPCKKCGARYSLETRLCTKCGLDLRTGRTLATQTSTEAAEPEEVEEDEEYVSRREWVVSFAGQLVPGLFQPMIVILSGVGFCIASVIGGYAFWAMREGEMTGGVAIGALAIVVNAQSMAWIVTGDFQILIDAVADMGSLLAYFVMLVLVPLGPLAWLISTFLVPADI